MSRGARKNKLLNTAEAAALFGVHRNTLEHWRIQMPPRGPRFYKLHRHAVRYSMEDLEAWLHERLTNLQKMYAKKRTS